MTEIFIGEKEKRTNKGIDQQYVVVFFFITQYNSSLSSFVPNFKILSQEVAEKCLTEKNVHMYYIGVTEGKIENLKKEGKMWIHLHNTLCLPEGVHTI